MLTLLVIIVVALLFLAAVAVLIFQEGKVEVDPKKSVVYKNVITGNPFAYFAGLHFFIPGLHKRLADVTLQNEPSDPPLTRVITGDAVNVDVDYVIFTQLVINPVLAATKIDFVKRRELIIARIEAFMQNHFLDASMEDIFTAVDSKAVVNKSFVKGIENLINTDLERDVEAEWGICVKAEIENVIPPQKVAEVAEESATAEKEGKRIKTKAEAAGIPAWLSAVGDIFSDVARTRGPKGGKK